MLEGIEILSQVVVNNSITVLGIILGLIALFLFVCTTLAFIDSFAELDGGAFLAGIILLLLTLISIAGSYYHLTPINYTEYKVTISNEVNFKEFNEKYELLWQEGEIYSIKEKKGK